MNASTKSTQNAIKTTKSFFLSKVCKRADNKEKRERQTHLGEKNANGKEQAQSLSFCDPLEFCSFPFLPLSQSTSIRLSISPSLSLSFSSLFLSATFTHFFFLVLSFFAICVTLTFLERRFCKRWQSNLFCFVYNCMYEISVDKITHEIERAGARCQYRNSKRPKILIQGHHSSFHSSNASTIHRCDTHI